jgi:hypothetical protein
VERNLPCRDESLFGGSATGSIYLFESKQVMLPPSSCYCSVMSSSWFQSLHSVVTSMETSSSSPQSSSANLSSQKFSSLPAASSRPSPVHHLLRSHIKHPLSGCLRSFCACYISGPQSIRCSVVAFFVSCVSCCHFSSPGFVNRHALIRPVRGAVP